ncbi:hypothetical protein CRT60_01000 [Azospirillum palustre]|uniref:Uncharacterized protein n=1 Tax=Azospirillum palustre TaxID=2044885 RepID=A0A2B8BNA4_9PROT|nr:hypothetical protein [Azospirillum palustre]PGH59240.1 hypothetical protein CRT60_01000 [Azospirillum palustre]
MGDDWSSRWPGRVVGAVTCWTMVFFIFQQLGHAGVYDGADPVHRRLLEVMTLCAVTIGAGTKPPYPFLIVVMTVMATIVAAAVVGLFEAMGVYVLHGFQWPDFQVTGLVATISIPILLVAIMIMMLRDGSKKPSIRRHLTRISALSLVVSVIGLLITAARYWTTLQHSGGGLSIHFGGCG